MTVNTPILTAFVSVWLSACALSTPADGPDAGAPGAVDDDLVTEPGDETSANDLDDVGVPDDVRRPIDVPACEDASGATSCDCKPGYLTCDSECVGPEFALQDSIAFIPDRQCGTIGSCYGQTFEATSDGWLTAVRHAGVSDADTTLEIYVGGAQGCTPDGEILWRQLVPAGTDSMATIVLDTPMRVNQGSEYTLKFVGDDAGWIHTCEIDDSFKGGHALANQNWDIGFESTISACP
jgi:hypothetical protein